MTLHTSWIFSNVVRATLFDGSVRENFPTVGLVVRDPEPWVKAPPDPGFRSTAAVVTPPGSAPRTSKPRTVVRPASDVSVSVLSTALTANRPRSTQGLAASGLQLGSALDVTYVSAENPIQATEPELAR
jgi:hypothetical protein